MKMTIGAQVQYCGHNGSFAADIYDFGETIAVVAGDPVTMENLNRTGNPKANFHLSDFPVAGAWKPNRGVFVVPSKQFRKI